MTASCGPGGADLGELQGSEVSEEIHFKNYFKKQIVTSKTVEIPGLLWDFITGHEHEHKRISGNTRSKPAGEAVLHTPSEMKRFHKTFSSKQTHFICSAKGHTSQDPITLRDRFM